MKKVLLFLLLAASVASAQVYPPDASSGTATSIGPSAFPLLAPNGSGSAPSYSFTAQTDMGCWNNTGLSFGEGFQCQSSGSADSNYAYLQLFEEVPDTAILGVVYSGDEGKIQISPSAGGGSITIENRDTSGAPFVESEIQLFTYSAVSPYSYINMKAMNDGVSDDDTLYFKIDASDAGDPQFEFNINNAGGGATDVFLLDPSTATFAVPVTVPNGTQAAKSLTNGTADVGIYFVATPALAAEVADVSNSEASGKWQLATSEGRFGFYDTNTEFSGIKANDTSVVLTLDDENDGYITMNSTNVTITDLPLIVATSTYTNLPTATDGTIVYCSDCTEGGACAGSGDGAFAFASDGAWECPW